MRELSSDYISGSASNARDVYVKIMLNDDENTVYEADKIISLNIQRGITDGSFGIGFTPSDRLSCSIITNSKIPEKTRITVYIRFSSSGTWERLGRFYCKTCIRDGSAVNVTAFDAMDWQKNKQVKFGGKASIELAALKFPCTMQQMLDYIVTLRGMTCDFECQNFTIQKLPKKSDTEYYTVTELLGFIASAHGCNARFSYEGRLEFKSFAPAEAELNLSNVIDQTLDDSETFTVNGVLFYTGDDTQIYIDDVPGSEFDEDGEGIIKCTNPFASVEIAEYVWGQLGGLSYYGGSMELRGAGIIECGDVITVGNFKYPEDTAEYPLCITDIAYSISRTEGFVETVSSKITETKDSVSNTSPQSSGKGALSAIRIEGNKLLYNNQEYRLQYGNDKRIMCVTKGKLHHIVGAESVNESYIEAATAVLTGLTDDCDIEFDANIYYADNSYSISGLFDSTADLSGVSIDWGDGAATEYPEISHVYGKQGMFRIKIGGLPDTLNSITMSGISSFWNGYNSAAIGSHGYIGGPVKLISDYSPWISKITWGEKITEVENGNGYGEKINGELIEISVPPKVQTIGSYFASGNQCNYVYIPPECTSIEGNAFYNVPLKCIEISPDGDTLTLGGYAFNQIASSYDNCYSCVTSLEIPARVQIEQNSFYNMGTRIVKFESGTVAIPSYSLYCTNFKCSMGIACTQNYNEMYIFIPATVTIIASNMFYGGTEQPRVVIVYEGSSSDWDKIEKNSGWNSGNTNVKYIYGKENYESYPFCVQEIKKFHEFTSADDSVYVAGSGISIYDSTISVNPGNGLSTDMHGKINVVAGDGIRCDDYNFGKVSVNVGDGIEIVVEEGATSVTEVNGKVTLKKATNDSLGGVKIGDGIEITEDGTISTKAKEYIEGEGIKIADNTISLQTASATSLGGVKVGKGLKIGDDGALDAEGGGSYTSGNGIEITEDNEINVTQATETAIGGIILGEGLEYDSATGKTNTVPNIQQAVIITEADAKYLLHEYTQIEYIAGNRIGYAGGQNQIVAQGYIIYKNGGTAPNGVTIVNKTYSSSDSLPDIQMYTDMSFSELAYYTYGSAYRITRSYVKLKNAGTSYDSYEWKNVKTDGSEVNNATFNNYNSFNYGIAFVWNSIQPPGYTANGVTYPYGCAVCTFAYRAKTNSTNYQFSIMIGNYYCIGFGSEAEYNAAVGLTYEPYTLTNVEETITEV
ncbi:MAG: leucine-rich repeat protein [Ruminiclostridium sp.]